MPGATFQKFGPWRDAQDGKTSGRAPRAARARSTKALVARAGLASALLLISMAAFAQGSGAQGGPFCNGLPATIVGTNGPDFLVGTGGDDVFVARGGSDVVFGLGGNDTVCAGTGNDRILGGSGNDTIFGHSGNDVILAGPGDDSVIGGRGADTVTGSSGDDTIAGSGGNDSLSGGRGRDTISGNGGADDIAGGAGNDVLEGNRGRNDLDGGRGIDHCNFGTRGTLIRCENPEPEVSISPTLGLVTSEDGGSDSFEVVLGSPPTDDVTIGVSSDTPSEGVTNDSELVFTRTNWNQPQTVTVTGVDDLDDDGDQPYTIELAPAIGGGYDAVNPEDVGVTNLDDDEAPSTGSIGDLVWLDEDRDGIQNPGEPGLAGVDVTLLDDNGAVVDTQTTPTDGSYLFSDLAAGDYVVRFGGDLGFALTEIDAGTDDSLDSDANVDLTDNIGRVDVSLGAGQSEDTIDAGFVYDRRISGFVWEDLDGDGRLERREPTVDGVVVNLLDDTGALISTTTAGTLSLQGHYRFDPLDPGSYTVEVIAPAGQGFTIQANDSTVDQTTGRVDVDLTAAISAGKRSAGLVTALGSIGDFVWLDSDRDGIQDPGEPGLGGVTVSLVDDTSATVASAVSEENGFYEFVDVERGDYTVGFVASPGLALTTPDAGNDDSADSDAVVSGQGEFVGSVDVTLGLGEGNETVDVGFVHDRTISGSVWEDLDTDGEFEAGELPVADVVVNIYDDTGVLVDSTTTESQGRGYFFRRLDASVYTVEVVAPNGFVFAVQANDSTVDQTTGRVDVDLTTIIAARQFHAGLVPATGSIGDFVWDDTNGDGIQDAGEPGLGGVEVELLDDTSTVIATQTTGSDGSYLFASATPGDYQLQFTPPVASPVYEFTTSIAGTDSTIDSDADAAGLTASFTLATGENNTTVDAGVVQARLLVGRVWDDDGDGIYEIADEPLTPNVTVNIVEFGGPVVATTDTGSSGGWGPIAVAPGVYIVQVVAPPGQTFTLQHQGTDEGLDSDVDPRTGRATVDVATSPQAVILAGLIADPTSFGSVGDFVWDDTNGDGIQDAGEPALAGVLVELLTDTGAVVAARTTASDGSYLFTSVTPGDYQIRFDPPAATPPYEFTRTTAGADSTIDSDADGSGVTALFTLASSENNTAIDAGVFRRAVTSGIAWNDQDADGIRAIGTEPNLSGVGVELLDGGGAVIASTTTSVLGLYSFGGLVPGDYTVRFTAPGGFDFTLQDQGADDSVDSDPNPTTGEANLSLSSGASISNVHAGFVTTPTLTGSIGDFVWEDDDADGIQDLGESGFEGVTVDLLDSGGGFIETSTTDSSGFYQFTGLAAGTYIVEFGEVADYSTSARDQGGDDAVDSDPQEETPLRTDPITLAPGSMNDDTVDAGYFFDPGPVAGVDGFVWNDMDGDGIQDAGESGIDGVTVNIYFTFGGPLTPAGSTVTAGGGFYSIQGAPPADHVVEFIAPGGTIPTLQDVGGNDTIDSDVGVDGRSGLFFLDGVGAVDVDAGFVAI